MDLNGNRLSDWEMARTWLMHERVTRMSAKVRNLISMALLGPLVLRPNSFSDRYQVSPRSEQSMNCTAT